MSSFDDQFKGFSKLSRVERLQKLVDMKVLEPGDVLHLEQGGLRDFVLGEKFIENVIGYFTLPMGVATNFRIDGKDFVIPMAVEETSIVAAASKTARWVRECGEITTDTLGRTILGQIQISKVKDLDRFKKILEPEFPQLIKIANHEVLSSMVKRGGGLKRLSIRSLTRPDGEIMAVVHAEMDAVEAMGANAINQVCEFLKTPIQALTGEKVTMCILSNLVDTKLTRATVRIRNCEADLAARIEEGSLFAQLDPYRAATNNKGVMNGIDPIVIATGNDWRAVEAGVHAYAARSGSYSSITTWKREGHDLVGELVAPIVVGTVGGVTTLHPMASMALRMMGSPSASELGRIMAAVGLVQNLGALRALTTVGIIEGHMKLHIKNLCLVAGATEDEMPEMVLRLEEILHSQKRVSSSHASEVLREVRRNRKA